MGYGTVVEGPVVGYVGVVVVVVVVVDAVVVVAGGAVVVVAGGAVVVVAGGAVVVEVVEVDVVDVEVVEVDVEVVEVDVEVVGVDVVVRGSVVVDVLLEVDVVDSGSSTIRSTLGGASSTLVDTAGGATTLATTAIVLTAATPADADTAGASDDRWAGISMRAASGPIPARLLLIPTFRNARTTSGSNCVPALSTSS